MREEHCLIALRQQNLKHQLTCILTSRLSLQNYLLPLGFLTKEVCIVILPLCPT
jgi:hypothetical protein